MSRGPTREVGIDEGADYSLAFKAANRMVDEGRSWSGNERNRCFLNTRQTRFADISATSGLDFLDDARAVAAVDWDTDGDLDLIQVNRTAPQIRIVRNNWPNDSHWIALRLVGTQSNRDAIGARVELHRDGGADKEIRTLYAGSSFLSQSSKWLHFGLGQDSEVGRVVVRWPGGNVESFDGMHANSRYVLVQGSGQIEEFSLPRPALTLAPTTAKTVESEPHRVVLSSALPLPELDYTDFAGNPLQTDWRKPWLIQLWASWCPTCRTEMQEFSDREADIRDSGIRVLALNVDGLGNDSSTLKRAKEAMKRRAFPFEVGRATESLLDKLELLRGELFASRQSFPLPSSFLIDPTGRLVCIYFGALEVDQLLDDADLFHVSAKRRRDLGTPMKGRWFTGPKPIRLSPLASVFREAGHEREADWYAEKAIPQMALGHCSLALDCERRGDLKTARLHYHHALALDPQCAVAYNYYGLHLMRRKEMRRAEATFKKALELDPNMADAHYNLGTVNLLLGRSRNALSRFREAIWLDPEMATGHAALGRVLQQQGRVDQASIHFEAAIAVDPYLAPPHIYLGRIRLRQARLSEAQHHFTRATEIAPDLPDAHEGLAQSLAADGKFSKALPRYRRALELNPDSLGAATYLAWHLATCPDDDLRSGQRAIELARRCVARTGRKSARILDVLAAAYAESGRFRDAIATATEAMQHVSTNSKLAKQIESRIAMYKKNQPYRQSKGG